MSAWGCNEGGAFSGVFSITEVTVQAVSAGGGDVRAGNLFQKGVVQEHPHLSSCKISAKLDNLRPTHSNLTN